MEYRRLSSEIGLKRQTKKIVAPTFTPRQKEGIVRKVSEEHYPINQLGKEYGISPHIIRDWVRKAGKLLPTRYRKILPANRTVQALNIATGVVTSQASGTAARNYGETNESNKKDLPKPQIKVSEAEDRPPPPPFLKVINLEKLMTSNSAANLNTQDNDNTELNSSIEEIADDICTPLSKVLRKTKKTNDYIKPVTSPMIPTQTFDCHLCQETFSGVEDFIIHQRFHDNEKSPKIHTQSFVCHLCQEIFSYEGDLVIHQRLHDNENPFKCDVCKATFASKGLYTSHKITHLMNKTELVCSLCPLRFVDEKSLKMHAKEEHNKCRFCKRNFDTPYALLMHLSRHDYCFLCNKIFKNLVSHNQKKHVDTNLSQIPIWQQQEILKRYFNKVLIIEPKSKGKDSKESEPKPGKEPAKICLKCNSELDERHICMNEANLRCFKCDVKFHNKSAFILHKRKHFYLYKRKFCNNCKKYMRKDGLINHKCSKVTKETNTKSTTTTENNEQSDDIDDPQKESNDQSNVSDDLDNIILLSPEYVKMMMECKGFVPPPTPMFFDTSDIYYNT